MRKTLMMTLVLIVAWMWPTNANAAVKVVTTTPGLAAIAKEVGGKHVSVTSLLKSNQDPHFADGRPSMIVKLSKADLLIYVGLSLEIGWLPKLLVNARNSAIGIGGEGHMDASAVCGKIQNIKGTSNRKLGDVHGFGSPHYLYDPNYGVRVAEGIAKRLASIDAKNAAAYKANLQSFKASMKKRISAWEKATASFKGTKIVGYHDSLSYLTTWLGLQEIGFVEPVPGVSPSPKHLAKLIVKMKKQKAKVVIIEPWYDAESATVVAKKSGAKVVRLPGDVPTGSTYADWVDSVVDALKGAIDNT